jgi:hypothetical protein
MKIKLQKADGQTVAELTVEGGGQLHRAPEAVVYRSDEPGVIYRLTQRDDADGAQVYTRIDLVLVLDK